MNLYDAYEQMNIYTNQNQELMRLFNAIHEKLSLNKALSQIGQQQIMHKKLMKINFQVIPNLCTNTDIKPTDLVN